METLPAAITRLGEEWGSRPPAALDGFGQGLASLFIGRMVEIQLTRNFRAGMVTNQWHMRDLVRFQTITNTQQQIVPAHVGK